MTKDVMIRVRGMQFENGQEGERIESIQRGEYYKRNDAHYVLFEEVIEGTNDIINNMIKFRPGEMYLKKKGAVNVNMDFLEHKKTLTNYRTPYGSLVIGLEADRVSFEEEEERILLDVDYVLDVNYEPLANCKIHVDITSLPVEGFSLRE